ncbi:hypothetical protein WBJ53_18630 [Spirosoma sp. SC4-14]|uniref:hypothetical protein n=1 Tax=Spirosoma sp. SC4-14 TaxID=3128900 RepID=UPI0030CDDCC6
MKRDDTLWKAIREDIFDDFLRFFFANADELVQVKLGIAKRLLSSSLPKGKVRSLMNFLRYYVRLENQQASD